MWGFPPLDYAMISTLVHAQECIADWERDTVSHPSPIFTVRGSSNLGEYGAGFRDTAYLKRLAILVEV